MVNTYGFKKTKQKVVVDKAKATPLRRERVESFFCSVVLLAPVIFPLSTKVEQKNKGKKKDKDADR
jgi:hypothetical protein